jgi:signal transduction histidine kinase
MLPSPTITHETAERLRRVAAAQGVSADDLLSSLLDTHELPLAGQRELNEMKKRLMHTISHEFRTPLAAIQSSSEILTRYADRLTDEQRTARLTNIRAQVHHLRGMLEKTEELLQANMEPPFAYKQPLKLETVLRDILAANDHPKVRYHVEGTPRPVYADAHLLRQMITNLLQNAVTYSPPGAHIEVFQYYASDTVYIAVKDEGMGISENDLKYVFEPFFRGDNADTVPGTGLGLSVVRHAVEAHDGDVFVYSALEQGTVVLVQLPYGESQSMSIGA